MILLELRKSAFLEDLMSSSFYTVKATILEDKEHEDKVNI